MPRFSAQVKLYALEQRRAGKVWKRVQEGVREEFKIPPPSIRAMQKWEKAIDRDALSRMIAEEAKRKLPQSQEAALQQVVEGLIPVLWRAKDAGGDLERQGWFWLFGVMERQLGSEKFERFVSEYMSWRSGSATRVEPGLQPRSGDEGTHQAAR